MMSQISFVVLAVCLTGTVLSFPASSPVKSVSINAPVSGGYLNPIAAYAGAGGYYQQGYGSNFASPYVAPNLGGSQTSVSGVNHHGSAFNAYSSTSPFSHHSGSHSYNPYFGTKSFNKISSVPGATTKVSHGQTPFGAYYGAQETVGIPGLPGSYTISTKTTATKNPVVYPTYGGFHNNYGAYPVPHYQVPAYGVFAHGPPRQISYQHGYPGYGGGSYNMLKRLKGY